MPLALQVLGIVVPLEVAERLLPSPPEGWERPATRNTAKLQVLIDQEGKCKITGDKLGLIKDVRFDHRPAVSQRLFDPVANDTVPSIHDPKFLDAIKSASHDRLTFKNNGSGRGDVTAAAHVKNGAKAHQEHRQRVAQRECGQHYEPKGTIPSRPNGFPPKGVRKLRSRGFERRAP